jgi:hypothetical protein
MKAIGNAHASLDYARSPSVLVRPRAAFTVTPIAVVTGGFAADTKDTKSRRKRKKTKYCVSSCLRIFVFFVQAAQRPYRRGSVTLKRVSAICYLLTHSEVVCIDGRRPHSC